MNALIYCFVILFFVVGCSGYVYAAGELRLKVDCRTFLKAIDQVESGGRDHAHGKAGERSRYQLTEAVWYQHTKKDFSYAHNRMLAWGVAERHFDFLLSCLLASDLPCDVEHMALAWNAGISAVRNNRLSPVHHDYAERVGNLYADFSKGSAQ